MKYLKAIASMIINDLRQNKKRSAARKGSAAYWTSHMVADETFKDRESSLDHFHWRNAQYPGYIELMPVSGYDNKVIVDYGCGPGNDLVGFTEFSKPQKLYGLDVSKTALIASEKRLKLHRGKIDLIHIEENENKIPLPDKSVDLIHSSGVLHHCKNLDAILMEFYRILKDDGQIQIMIYNYDSLWLHLYTAYMHQIERNLYADLDIRKAFKHTTDGPDCPISKCYKSDEFTSYVEQFGFIGKLKGVSISLTELSILPKRFDAIQNRKLPREHREFLSEIIFDEKGWPLYKNQVAGIDSCFSLKKKQKKE
ncbi:MAG: class I SAM-dependent methyltransferase [Bacteroidales bacterium]|jgi:ubiquinone/menaquinone biosynthesis C-methylase UbiE